MRLSSQILRSTLICGMSLGITSASLLASEPLSLANVPEPVPLSADEPLAAEFSLERAAQSLDITALHWQKTRQCAACHTLPPYLMARPLLTAVSAEPPDVRRFFEKIVAERLEPEPALPKDGIAAVTVEVAVALAFHDRATTGKLHPRTREELDRMWTLQRADGSWEWPFRDTPPIKSDEHYGVTLAALGTGMAPESYAETEAAQQGLAGIRQYLKTHPATSLHQQAMLLWVSQSIDGILTPEDEPQISADLLSIQRADGGWSMANLIDNSRDPQRQTEAGQAARAKPGYGTEFLVYVGRDDVYQSRLESDAYATGLVLYVLRQAGMPANDPQIRRGVDWLKSHQRASGRWFTPSQGWHTEHRIANAGTAYAIIALHACGEVPDR